MDWERTTSQELEISIFQTTTKQEPESDGEWKPSTQEINNICTQEAANATDFFDNLRENQISESDSSCLQQSDENQIKNEDLDTLSIDSLDIVKPSVEKKKRNRTPEEMDKHLKDKEKEKKRIAAQKTIDP